MGIPSGLQTIHAAERETPRTHRSLHSTRLAQDPMRRPFNDPLPALSLFKRPHLPTVQLFRKHDGTSQVHLKSKKSLQM